MGFINPGKPLKRARYRAKQHKPKKLKIAPPRVIEPLTLSTLPVDILYKIFVLSKPNNTLPLVNKEFYNLLKFDPQHETNSGNWRNLSLVIEMIKTWYLVDLNTRIDFNLIHKKLEYYESRLLQVIQEFAYHQHDPDQSIEVNGNYKMIKRNLDIILHTVHKLQLNSTSKGISDKVLANKFVSKGLIEQFFKSYVFSLYNDESANEYMNLMSEGEIVYERKTRLRFLRYKFKELSLNFQNLINQIHNETTALPTVNSNEDDQSSTPAMQEVESTEELILDENEKLPEYDDEKQQIEPWLLNSSTNLSLPFSIRENTVIYDFEKVRYNRNFPTIIYRNGINTNAKFQLLKLLQRIYLFRFEDMDEILISTLYNFKPEEIHNIKTSSLSLDQIMTFILSAKHGSITQIPVINLLKLYHEYEPKDCSEFGINYNGDLISEDISKALIQLLTDFYNQNEHEDLEIWRFVLESKNYNLAQLLMRFSECPSFELL
ncbi:uncharacterized protein CANTADRAFT_99241 [Suhomyces tanzawaensis NRRL Y-17324]|uniref:Uncharacterized protein n=1 Tax=Suhomyces tanzawaensis NRRL Y-17324 TaxID=984487 RepID=A0A1E4SN78_9ASCO|nr:uncharacterized protein CANTADRAFT_99241 [Suhomyces tanzawaensis NRRL Y-17324]ODV80877.1 hypothetical protein CANTADRAFT_99241 [Suhomyces tanzawaensis NRRL Y-17324]